MHLLRYLVILTIPVSLARPNPGIFDSFNNFINSFTYYCASLRTWNKEICDLIPPLSQSALIFGCKYFGRDCHEKDSVGDAYRRCVVVATLARALPTLDSGAIPGIFHEEGRGADAGLDVANSLGRDSSREMLIVGCILYAKSLVKEGREGATTGK